MRSFYDSSAVMNDVGMFKRKIVLIAASIATLLLASLFIIFVKSTCYVIGVIFGVGVFPVGSG